MGMITQQIGHERFLYIGGQGYIPLERLRSGFVIYDWIKGADEFLSSLGWIHWFL